MRQGPFGGGNMLDMDPAGPILIRPAVSAVGDSTVRRLIVMTGWLDGVRARLAGTKPR